MLAERIAQILQIELTVPVGQHGSVIVGPAVVVGGLRMRTIGTENLDVFHADSRAQPAVVYAHIDGAVVHVNGFGGSTRLRDNRRGHKQT